MNRAKLISRIRRASAEVRSLTETELRARSLELKHLAMIGTAKDALILKGFPVVVEASRRCLGMVHHDVQLLCGIEMVHGHIAEMKTGEGKTLTASLACYLLALYGQGVHMVTFNDYLAERDCQHLRPLFHMLGLSVDVLTENLIGPQRQRAYRCDITYGAAKEFGFDFLRDRLEQASTGDSRAGVMRGTNYALVDEADSILIDEARTPLVIGMHDLAQAKSSNQYYRWAAEHAALFEEHRHFHVDAVNQRVNLNAEGVMLARRLPLYDHAQPASIGEIYDYLRNAIKARRDLHMDKDYTIRDGEIVIVDEFTGRPAEGRQWQHGIQQSVQAKEGVEITPPTRTAASITIQSLFRRYKMFAGMTGTAWTSRREFNRVYKKHVVRIPTHRPTMRTSRPARVFATMTQKFDAVAQCAQQLIQLGRPVLIGTRSVGQSELLASYLHAYGLTFQILNAKQLSREAEIIAMAGQSATITIATNMAGRGTDIQLSPAVRDAGGLHVIVTEIHESQRIDWQLIGRASRQGDPGSYQVLVSLDDEILVTGLGARPANRLKTKYAQASPDQLTKLFRLFERAQRRTERKYLIDRLIVLRNDWEKKRSCFAMGQDPYLFGN
ncbi:MAG: preprotein translocase subunit SecA [Pirellulaceae bacterium]|nr:preprotein translocase subunit SecA [Pirellulaceae bacterium]